MPMVLEARPLEGEHVRLDLIGPDNREGLSAALNCDPETWEIMSGNGCGDGMDEFWSMLIVEVARAQRHRLRYR